MKAQCRLLALHAILNHLLTVGFPLDSSAIHTIIYFHSQTGSKYQRVEKCIFDMHVRLGLLLDGENKAVVTLPTGVTRLHQGPSPPTSFQVYNPVWSPSPTLTLTLIQNAALVVYSCGNLSINVSGKCLGTGERTVQLSRRIRSRGNSYPSSKLLNVGLAANIANYYSRGTSDVVYQRSIYCQLLYVFT